MDRLRPGEQAERHAERLRMRGDSQSPNRVEERVYRCRHCGMVNDRDKNAAVNMLIRAGLVPEANETVRRHPDAVPEAHASLGLGIPRL